MLAALFTHAPDGASSARAGRRDAAQVFKALDGGDKGHLTVDDLQAAVVNISAEGARRAEQAGKAVEKLFARLDGDGDGQLTQAEFEAAVPRGLGGGPHGPRGPKPEPDGEAPTQAQAAVGAEAAVKAYESVGQLGQDTAAA